jgi:hypothetical protein
MREEEQPSGPGWQSAVLFVSRIRSVQYPCTVDTQALYSGSVTFSRIAGEGLKPSISTGCSSSPSPLNQSEAKVAMPPTVTFVPRALKALSVSLSVPFVGWG